MSRALVITLTACALGGCSVDPCDGKAGTCLAVDVRGSIARLDSLRFALHGAVEYGFTAPLPSGVTTLPVGLALELPDRAAGSLTVVALGLDGARIAGLGTASTSIIKGQHAPLIVTLSPTSAASCADAILDGDETDSDCGGSCSRCADGKMCKLAGDCTSGACVGGACQAAVASCTDGIKNGDESDTDCGGSCATKCADGKMCKVTGDCAAGACTAGVCKVSASCSDGKIDGDESDVDCGGSCAKCMDGKMCKLPADCGSGVCTGGACAAPSCSDAVRNGKESDVDCGGACSPCADGKMCSSPADCQSGVCTGGHCASPACSDGVKNGSETDSDCGGTCSRCADGKMCKVMADCLSSVCSGGLCVEGAGCNDGVRNGTESDVDCGGTCSKCADGKMCKATSDCQSAVCTGGSCAAPSCSDGTKNGKETDVDCGGACSRCADGKMCSAGADCASGACAGGKCLFSLGGMCTFGSDCASGSCLAGKCGLPAPTITSVTPPVGPLATATAIQVRGAGFVSGATVSVGGVPATKVVLKSASEIDAVTPASGTRGKIALVVTNPDGQSATGAFTFFPASVDLGGVKYYAAGSAPGSVLVADFNADKHLDIAVLSVGGKSVTILLNNGDGSYGAPDTIPLNTIPSDMVIADFTSDGFPDIATANINGTVKLLTNNQDGTFSVSTPYQMFTEGLNAITAGDFDKDGKIDVVVATGFPTQKMVFLHGGGNGSLNNPIAFGGPLAAATAVLVADDFDGDGALDFVALSSSNPRLDMFLGSGSAPVNFVHKAAGSPGAQYCYSLTHGDLGNSGKPDLIAICDGDGSNNTYGVCVGLNDGNGNFVDNWGCQPSGLAQPLNPNLAGPTGRLADLDKDGKLDLVLTNPPQRALMTMHGLGGGSFSAAVSYGASVAAGTGLAIGDLDGDGALDVTMPSGSTSEIGVALGNGKGGLWAPRRFGAFTSTDTPSGIAAGDFTGDGKADVAVGIFSGKVAVYPGNGDGTFGAAKSYATGAQPTSLVMDDFDGDGVLDIAVSSIAGQPITVLINKGSGTVHLNEGGAADGILSGDFDGDGLRDLVVDDEKSACTVDVFLGKGNGTFAAAVSTPNGCTQSRIAVGDFNGDKKDDIASPNAMTGQVTILLASGSGMFASNPTVLSLMPGAPASVAARDFNGDGLIDLAIQNSGAGISMFYGGGDGSWKAGVDVSTVGSYLVAVDLNLDGALDLLPIGSTSINVLQGNGKGSFTPLFTTYNAMFNNDVATADFNGDGLPDVVCADETGLNFNVILNRSH